MIILNLTGCRRKPKHCPDKIRLIKGEYNHEYDLHPMVRNTKWYKNTLNDAIKRYPNARADWPIGISRDGLAPGAKITNRK